MAESSIKEMVEHHSLADARRRKIPSKENPPPGLANWLKTFHVSIDVTAEHCCQ